MRKTDIGTGKLYRQGGQEHKYQTVITPFGELSVPSFVRVPRLTANKRTWKIWYERFILYPIKMKEYWNVYYINKRLKERKK